jgi:hypothetical protein
VADQYGGQYNLPTRQFQVNRDFSAGFLVELLYRLSAPKKNRRGRLWPHAGFLIINFASCPSVGEAFGM